MGLSIDEVIAKIKGSLGIILDYAGIDGETAQVIKALVKKYIECSDRAGSDDDTRKLRKELTKAFYLTYKKCYFKTISEEDIPLPVKMFMYFGYMDEKLAGAENAVLLGRLADVFGTDPNGHVFTFYAWLNEIYAGRRNPSISEMSLDYEMNLRQLRQEGRITESEERELINNPVKRVEYEIDNFFFSASKIISGQVTVFCPIFSDHQLFKPLDKALVPYKAIYDNINSIREVDFSCFYRESVYTNPDMGIQKEYVQVEVYPDIILMPAAGSRGAMWQEISGRKRTTPARFVLPFFANDDIDKAIVRMCGEFRWELCRRIQGARWNDLSDPSITADYCDYIETFKKNRELSAEQREKIKSDYRKYRNSTKEMFVHDYMDLIMFESKGSLRLNKVARDIMFKYCPFKKEIRTELAKNGMYTKIVEKYEIKNKHSLHMSDLVMQKIKNSGNDIPEEIRTHRMFLES